MGAVIPFAAGIRSEQAGPLSRPAFFYLDAIMSGSVALVGRYSGCQKNVAVFERFFLQPYTRLCRNSV